MVDVLRCFAAVFVFAAAVIWWEGLAMGDDSDSQALLTKPTHVRGPTLADDVENEDDLAQAFFREGKPGSQQSMIEDFVQSVGDEEWDDTADAGSVRNDENERKHTQPLQSDALLSLNYNLIRVRPRGVHLVFIGDSITRYQYLSMAYFFRYGRWFDPTTFPNNLVNAHSFHHDYHPNEDWNEFFLQSNRMLQPLELCDCVRKFDNTIAIERRYFHDKERDNKLVYINISGKSTVGHEGLYGRVNPETVFTTTPFRTGLLDAPVNAGSYRPDAGETEDHDDWEYFTWADLIEFHLGTLNLAPTAAAIMNTGLHPTPFRDPLRALALKDSLESIGIKGVWKTTSFTKDEVQRRKASVISRDLDDVMCRTLPVCFDLSWTFHLKPQLYYDQLHFNEPVYRIMNEELLKDLDLLPDGYGNPLSRSLVTR